MPARRPACGRALHARNDAALIGRCRGQARGQAVLRGGRRQVWLRRARGRVDVQSRRRGLPLRARSPADRHARAGLPERRRERRAVEALRLQGQGRRRRLLGKLVRPLCGDVATRKGARGAPEERTIRPARHQQRRHRGRAQEDPRGSRHHLASSGRRRHRRPLGDEVERARLAHDLRARRERSDPLSRRAREGDGRGSGHVARGSQGREVKRGERLTMELPRFAILLAVAAFAGTATGQEKGTATQASTEVASPLAKKLDALKARFDKENQDAYDAYVKATTDDEKQKIIAGMPGKNYIPEFRAIAKEAAGTDTAAQAWLWVLRLGVDAKESWEIVELMLADHMQSTSMEELTGHVADAVSAQG